MSTSLASVTVIAVAGSAVVGGIFFAFSTFAMQALDRLAPAESVRAMQSVNILAVTPPFMSVLFGTALLGIALFILALTRLGEPGAAHHLVAGPVYLVGIVVTIVYNVPRNDALAALDPDSAEAPHHWHRYFVEWTAANHVRTITSIAAAIVYALALRAT